MFSKWKCGPHTRSSLCFQSIPDLCLTDHKVVNISRLQPHLRVPVIHPCLWNVNDVYYFLRWKNLWMDILHFDIWNLVQSSSRRQKQIWFAGLLIQKQVVCCFMTTWDWFAEVCMKRKCTDNKMPCLRMQQSGCGFEPCTYCKKSLGYNH